MSKGNHRRRAERAAASIDSFSAPDSHDSHDEHSSEGGAGHRHARLSRLIREELGTLLRDEVRDAAIAGTRATSLELSVDYRAARVGYVPDVRAGDATEVRLAAIARALERATPFLRAQLAETLELKRVPTLRFVLDRDALTSLATEDPWSE